MEDTNERKTALLLIEFERGDMGGVSKLGSLYIVPKVSV